MVLGVSRVSALSHRVTMPYKGFRPAFGEAVPQLTAFPPDGFETHPPARVIEVHRVLFAEPVEVAAEPLPGSSPLVQAKLYITQAFVNKFPLVVSLLEENKLLRSGFGYKGGPSMLLDYHPEDRSPISIHELHDHSPEQPSSLFSQHISPCRWYGIAEPPENTAQRIFRAINEGVWHTIMN